MDSIEIKNVKLVAEFMELEPIKGVYKIPEFERIVFGERENAYESNDHCHAELSSEFTESELMYDTEWNWLMPVIDKIIKSSKYFEYKEAEFDRNANIFISPGCINHTFSDVLKYIKWYNLNKDYYATK